MKNFLKGGLLLAVSLFVSSCGIIEGLEDIKDDVDEQLTGSGQVVFNVDDAVQLFQTKEMEEGYTSNLFKKTADNTFEEVTLVRRDSLGNIYTGETVSVEIFEQQLVGDSYLFINGNFEFNDGDNILVWSGQTLVDLSDGSFVEMEDNSLAFAYYGIKLGTEPLQQDKDGNYYYRGFDGELKKMTINSLEDYTISNYLSGGQKAWGFSIDSNGNGFYESFQDDFRIQKATGGLEIVSVPGEVVDFWLGTDDHFYFITEEYSSETGYNAAIYQATIEGTEISYEVIWDREDNVSDNMVASTFSNQYQGHYKIQRENSILFVDTFYGNSDVSNARNWEFDHLTNTVSKIDHLPQVKDGSLIVNSDQYYYIASGTALYKVDLYTHAVTVLLQEGEFEIYWMDVDKDDNLKFYGNRFSDGKLLLVEVDASNTAQALDPGMSSMFKTISTINR